MKHHGRGRLANTKDCMELFKDIKVVREGMLDK